MSLMTLRFMMFPRLRSDVPASLKDGHNCRVGLLSGAEGLARLLGNCCLSMSAVSVPSLGQLACINSVISLAYVFNYVL